MKFNLSCFIVVFIVSSIYSFAQIIGKVVSITDGDTFSIFVKDSTIKVRLYGIDSPEKKQPFGSKAKQELGNLIFNKEITIRSMGHDRYSRLLGIVFLDSICVNEYMLKNGLAWHFIKYDKNTEWQKLEGEDNDFKIEKNDTYHPAL